MILRNTDSTCFGPSSSFLPHGTVTKLAVVVWHQWRNESTRGRKVGTMPLHHIIIPPCRPSRQNFALVFLGPRYPLLCLPVSIFSSRLCMRVWTLTIVQSFQDPQSLGCSIETAAIHSSAESEPSFAWHSIANRPPPNSFLSRPVPRPFYSHAHPRFCPLKLKNLMIVFLLSAITSCQPPGPFSALA